MPSSMGRPAGSANHSAVGRLGCKYADQYYAGQFNITDKEAQTSYMCALKDSELDKIAFSCPFEFLPECLDALPKSLAWKDGLVIGLLGNKTLTCRLLPISYESSPHIRQPDYIQYECSNCKGTIKGNVEFMKYCYQCGARIV